MEDLLREAVSRGASDLHITVGVPPVLRINGHLTHTKHPPLFPQDTDKLFEAITTAEQRLTFRRRGELDFSYAVAGFSRFRVNAFRQRGSTAIAVRLVADKVPALDDFGFPEVIKALARRSRGLVLVTGPTGSGKSTTLAAMLDLINSERACHILTLEDPIEYLHKHNKSIINQREIGADSLSFAAALRAALREDPDVILVGEMRDPETIATAITAAETGHLVFATLHTNDAAQTVDRIIDGFPPHQQTQIRVQLALTLQGIIAQQLLTRLDGTGRVAVQELLVVTPAIRNVIREGKTHLLGSIIQTGAKAGMQAMDMALRDLCRRGVVSYKEALSRAIDPETFTRLVNGD